MVRSARGGTLVAGLFLALAGCGGSATEADEGAAGTAGMGAQGGTAGPDGGGTGGGSAGSAAVSGVGGFGFGGPRVLVDDLRWPTRLAIDAARVYFAERGDRLDGMSPTGRVASVPKTGGTVTTLAQDLLGPGGLDVDDTHVYWAAFGAGFVGRVPKAGGTSEPTFVGNGTARYSELRLVGDRIFVADIREGNVSWFAKDLRDGGIPIGSLRSPTRIAANGGEIFVTDAGADDAANGTITTWRDSAGPALLAENLAQPDGVAIAGPTIYFATSGDGTIWQVDRPGAPAPFVTGERHPFALATDRVHLYVTNRVTDDAGSCVPEGTLVAIPLDAPADRVVLADGLSCPSTLAVDDDGLYWVTNGNDMPVGGGSLMMIPKTL